MGGVGGLSALWDALNIVDIALALNTGFKTKFRSSRGARGASGRGRGYEIPMGRESPEYTPQDMGRTAYEPRGSLQHLRPEDV